MKLSKSLRVNYFFDRFIAPKKCRLTLARFLILVEIISAKVKNHKEN